MFKAGDKVQHFGQGTIYSVEDSKSIGGDNYIKITYAYRTDWYRDACYSLAKDSKIIKNSNPAIEEYTKTVTVRKIRAQSVIKLPRPRVKLKNEVIVEAGYKGVLLKTRGHQSYECFADAEGLRTLAKQLTEIADVLEEEGKS